MHMIVNMEALIHKYLKKEQVILQDGQQQPLSDVEKAVSAEVKRVFASLRQNNLIGDAITSFNIKIKSGMARFRDLGIFIYQGEKDAKKLGDFIFKYTEKFSKEKLGEFFGDEAKFCNKVLKYYLSHFNFEKMFVTDAMRYFLTFTEIPGEAQKIERVCYSFAEKYAEDNPDLMDYDNLCILSFLIIMCHSNLYNPNVDPRQKMSFDMFKSMAKEIKVQGQSLQLEYVKRVYDNIVSKPIAVHWAQQRKDFLKEASSANLKRKEELTRIENTKNLEEMNEALGALKEKNKKKMQNNSSEETPYLKINNLNFMKPFLNIMWKELSAFFSILIENMAQDSEFEEVVSCAISLIRQADYFDMDQERDAFIMVFIQFSGLDLIENKELSRKNLYFITVLVELGCKYPQHLHKGWKILLNTIMKIDYLLSIAGGADKKARQELKDAKLKNKGKKDIELSNCHEISTFVSRHLIDMIFNCPSNLDNRSVNDFFDSLGQLALERIGHRDFNDIIQRIVSVLGAVTSSNRKYEDQLVFFETVCHRYVDLIKFSKDKDQSLNFYCIDSLKQIIVQFLSRRETIETNNQQRILQPFINAAKGNKKLTRN
jgi:Sec7-like guanine-nucleotide exchange factor